jgi:hypothetical protein
MAKIAGSGAQVIAMFTIPAYTALVELAGVKLNYHPQLVVSNVGSDATTLAGLLKAFSKGKAPATLINGMVSDTYLPALSDTSNSWITLFKQIHDQYIPKLPFDGNVAYGFGLAYTFAEALQRAGANPTRQSLVDAIQKGGLSGPGLVPFRFSSTSHAGYTGVQIGTIKDGALSLTGQPLTTDDASGAIQPYTGSATEAPSNGIPPAAH